MPAPAPPPGAVALGAMRPLSNGVGRYYTPVTFPENPWQGCERMIRMGVACGLLAECQRPCGCYAVLDVLNEDGDIIQDFCIPSAHAFRWFYRMLHWRVEIEGR